MTYDNQEQLEADLSYWQKALSLQDWEIKARIYRRADMDPEHNGYMGLVQRSVGRRRAMIKILDHNDSGWLDSIRDGYELDQEDTLVHELLHIHTRPILDQADDAKQEGLFQRMKEPEEFAICAIAKALVALRRQLSATLYAGIEPNG